MAEDLWSPIRTERRAKAAPLAVRVRPRTLDEIAGQQHCLAEGSLLRRLIEQDALQSMIVAGPPGTGKTTLAEVIAARTGAYTDRAHGATTGVKELRDKIESAARRPVGACPRRSAPSLSAGWRRTARSDTRRASSWGSPRGRGRIPPDRPVGRLYGGSVQRRGARPRSLHHSDHSEREQPCSFVFAKAGSRGPRGLPHRSRPRS
jgi:hypothetical protein